MQMGFLIVLLLSPLYFDYTKWYIKNVINIHNEVLF